MMTQRNAQRSTLNVQRSRLQTSAPLRLCVKIPDPKTRSRAFTLIETALAMLAIGLGLLALFGLGRLGLQATKESENDARCALMADAVFETLRDYNARFVENARTNALSATWIQQWDLAYGTPKQIPFPPVANMSASENLYLMFAPESTLAPAFDRDALSLSDWNPRYQLFRQNKYASPVAGNVNLLQFTLLIYPDGDTYSSDPRIYHTTLTNTGGL